MPCVLVMPLYTKSRRSKLKPKANAPPCSASRCSSKPKECRFISPSEEKCICLSRQSFLFKAGTDEMLLNLKPGDVVLGKFIRHSNMQMNKITYKYASSQFLQNLFHKFFNDSTIQGEDFPQEFYSQTSMKHLTVAETIDCSKNEITKINTLATVAVNTKLNFELSMSIIPSLMDDLLIG
ncbi:unnamed protein product, partial [Protopolystoma xenopodis]